MTLTVSSNKQIIILNSCLTLSIILSKDGRKYNCDQRIMTGQSCMLCRAELDTQCIFHSNSCASAQKAFCSIGNIFYKVKKGPYKSDSHRHCTALSIHYLLHYSTMKNYIMMLWSNLSRYSNHPNTNPKILETTWKSLSSHVLQNRNHVPYYRSYHRHTYNESFLTQPLLDLLHH